MSRYPVRSRPLLAVAALFGVGVVASATWAGVSVFAWSGAVLILAGVGFLTATARGTRLVSLRRLHATVLVAAAIVGAGAARHAAWAETDPRDVSRFAGTERPVELFGRLFAPADQLASGTRWSVDADSVRFGAHTLSITGRVVVRLQASRFDPEPRPFPAADAGAAVRVAGVLQALPRQRNPSDFDYGSYLKRKGFGAQMNVRDAAGVQITEPPSGLFYPIVNAARARVERALLRHVSAEQPRAVMRALLLADRTGLGDDLRQSFARSGLMHVLAVSGLHVLLVGMSLFALLKPLLGRTGLSWRAVEVVRAILTVALLSGYVLLCGAPVSAVRALVMAGLVLASHLSQRTNDPLNTLGVAGLVLLSVWPASLFEVGFQLSFSAVAALILLAPVLTEWAPPLLTKTAIGRWGSTMVVASLAATAGTAPVLLYHFGQVPLAGVVLNLPAIPATMTALAGGIGAVVLDGWATPAAHLAGAAAEMAAALLIRVGSSGEAFVSSSLVHGYVRDPLWLTALVASLAAFALAARPRARVRAAGVSLACSAGALWIGALAPAPPLDVLFFDVGQGDAALVTFPDGRTLLVDAGMADDYRDAGARTILPHLQRRGIRRIDAVVLSHPHADHYGGLFSLLDAVDIGRVVHNGQRPDSPLHDSLLARLDAAAVPHGTLSTGDTLHVSSTARIGVFQGGDTGWDDANEASLVLQLHYGETRLLLTGDAEAAAERHLVRRYGHQLRSDVVKVAHHGSRTSSTRAFVDAASDPHRPPIAVVSVASRNRYGLPDEEPLAAWNGVGAELLTTAEEGAVWLQSDGTRYRRMRWRNPSGGRQHQAR